MAGGFVKIYGDRLLGSSLMDEAVETRWMFMVLAAAANEDGYVRCQTVGAAARLANLTEAQASLALEALSSPDSHSSTPDHDGRRILRAEGGWTLVNHRKYRELRTESQAKRNERQRRWRVNRERTHVDGVDAVSPKGSASASVSVKGEGSGEREDERGEKLLRQGRVAKEREFYALISRLAQLQPDKDPTQIAREITEYTAKDGRKVDGIIRPEQLSDARLEKSLQDAQWWIEEIEGKHGKTA